MTLLRKQQLRKSDLARRLARRRCNMAVGFFESLGAQVPSVVAYLARHDEPQQAPVEARLHLVRSA
ncbi:MAG: hypothetical protein ACRDLR_09485 [Gaiellaceae bacterium]